MLFFSLDIFFFSDSDDYDDEFKRKKSIGSGDLNSNKLNVKTDVSFTDRTGQPSALLINQRGEKGVFSSKAVSGESMSKKLKGKAVVSSDQVLFFRYVEFGPEKGELTFRLLLIDEQVYSKASKKLKALEKAKLAAELKAKQGKDVSKKSTKKSSQRDAYEENPEDFMDPETPVGERKQLSLQMYKQYSPAAVDRAWYAWWGKAGFFTVDAKSSKPAFVIVLPPPNVTGLLHIGHALTTAIQI